MSPNTRWASTLVAGAAVLLAIALGVSPGFRDALALALVTASAVMALCAARLLFRPPQGSESGAVSTILSIGLALGLAHHLLYPSRIAVRAGRTDEFRIGLIVCVAILATYLWANAPPALRRARFVALTITLAVLGAIVIRGAPAPRIDVWHYRQLGALALSEGSNPYSATYPNIYGPGTRFLDPSLLSADGHFVTAYPYTPLTVLLDVPGALAGDVRWTLLAAAIASAWLVRLLGRGSTASELGGALLLLQPQGFWVIERAWTEPIALVTLLLAAFAVLRARGSLLPGLAFGLALSSKQYAPLLVAPLWLAVSSPARWRSLAIGVLVAGAIALPFLVADPAGLVRGVVEFQLHQPFRPDALSWPAMVLQLGGPLLPTWPAFPIAAAALAATVRRTVSPGQALLAGATAWIAFVAFNKQAFCNYYWLAVGLLCAAAAALVAPVAAISAPHGESLPSGGTKAKRASSARSQR